MSFDTIVAATKGDGPRRSSAAVLPAQTVHGVVTDISDDKKVSLFRNTSHSAIEAFIIATPALIVIPSCLQFIQAVKTFGHPWDDHHALSCTLCMSTLELISLFTHDFEWAYCKRKLLMWPTMIVTFVIMSGLIFEFDPGFWTLILMAISWACGNCATYPLLSAAEKKKNSFLHHCFIGSFLYGFILKGTIEVIIFSNVTVTRYVAKNSGLVTSILTGFVLPLTAVISKNLLFFLLINRMSECNDSDPVFFSKYAKTSKMVATMVILTPFIMMYLNENLKLGFFSAAIAVVTELGGKLWVIYSMGVKEQFAEEGVKDVLTSVTAGAMQAAMKKKDAGIQALKGGVGGRVSTLLGGEGEGGGNAPAEGVDAFGVGEEGNTLTPPKTSSAPEATAELQEVLKAKQQKRKAVKRRLSVRWYGEMVGEKASILVAGPIAAMVLDEVKNMSKVNMGYLTIILFVLEVFADATFVYVVDTYYDVPMLNEFLLEDLVSIKAAKRSMITALILNGMVMCISMAVMVKVG